MLWSFNSLDFHMYSIACIGHLEAYDGVVILREGH